jgi:hypothetical protein
MNANIFPVKTTSHNENYAIDRNVDGARLTGSTRQKCGVELTPGVSRHKPVRNELGRKRTYRQYIEQQQLPGIEGFYIPDVRKIELAPWHSMGGLGAYLAGGIRDSKRAL